MSLDFQQVQQQVTRLGENARQREQRLKNLREKARRLLDNHANNLEDLRRKVESVVQSYDSTLRCGKPVEEALNSCFPPPGLPAQATILAADGSQIAPDRHAPVDYCLVNVGAIQLCMGVPDPPVVTVKSQLWYGDELFTDAGMITDARLALMRDLSERRILASLAASSTAPAITFTDGPMELWGSRTPESGEASFFQKNLQEYLEVLNQLCAANAVTAGYVDKPGSDLVVRLLEVAMVPQDELGAIRKTRPLSGVRDIDLFRELLQPGERSAVFEIQSISSKIYIDRLALHFFYLNVGRSGKPSIARVEVPAWVVNNPELLDHLHAALVDQCRMMGNRPYPYLLHRAHESALVSLAEKDQVTQMIALELRRRGVTVGDVSNKQAAKDLAGRTRYP